MVRSLALETRLSGLAYSFPKVHSGFQYPNVRRTTPQGPQGDEWRRSLPKFSQIGIRHALETLAQARDAMTYTSPSWSSLGIAFPCLRACILESMPLERIRKKDDRTLSLEGRER